MEEVDEEIQEDDWKSLFGKKDVPISEEMTLWGMIFASIIALVSIVTGAGGNTIIAITVPAIAIAITEVAYIIKARNVRFYRKPTWEETVLLKAEALGNGIMSIPVLIAIILAAAIIVGIIKILLIIILALAVIALIIGIVIAAVYAYIESNRKLVKVRPLTEEERLEEERKQKQIEELQEREFLRVCNEQKEREDAELMEKRRENVIEKIKERVKKGGRVQKGRPRNRTKRRGHEEA